MTPLSPHDTAASLEAILEIFKGDRRQAGHFARLYVEHTPDDARRLTAAVRDGDLDGITRASHAIRGSAAMIGAARLQGMAASMETSGLAGDLERAQTAYQPLLDELDRTCALLERYAAMLVELESIPDHRDNTPQEIET